MAYNNEKWLGRLSVSQQPNDYDTVLLEAVDSVKKMKLV